MTQPRVVDLPPASKLRSDDTLLGGWWHEVEGGRMICDLCPRACNLKPGDRGFCFVRQSRDGEMVLTTYGKSTGFCIDPIEKKPLNHFYPGTSVLSFGTAGCNLGCKFCQNHDISKARKVEMLSENAMPDAIARAAVELGCKSVAYTYNDPIIWAEYAIDTAKACRELGVKSVAVTAGYITEQARRPFFEFFDAANVDLKAFTEEFYEQVTLSHLQPVLDTLHWLKHETDVWFEITNLIIPDVNDSPDELRQLCDWVLQHVGDRVPVHFSAFHPDFRMLDRQRTPHEKLLEAHEIARSTGLKYVYVGNVHDAKHQSTYCDGCGHQVIERDWYQLGVYNLDHAKCTHCGHQLAGRFDATPGDWGRKRQPVKIKDYERSQQSVTARTTNMSDAKTGDSAIQASDQSKTQLSPEQCKAVILAASEMIAASAYRRDIRMQDATIGGLASNQVNGVYVSLKRNKQLRGCCGFTGSDVSLIEGMKHSARRTTLDDPRMPPVSWTELPHLDVEVWMLGGLIPVRAIGVDRANEIQVGRDGLLIQLGKQRGLLLPGVATDNDWNETKFLEQVCIKAKLPPTAWREADTQLHRFEGIVAKGKFDARPLQQLQPPAYLVTQRSLGLLAKFCGDNVRLMSSGAVPNYYAQGVGDGMVYGMVLTARLRPGTLHAGLQVAASKISLRPPMPLHSTLYKLCEELVEGLKRNNLDPATAEFDLAIFEDPAMNGTSFKPTLEGSDGRALLARGPGQASAICFQPDKKADQLLKPMRDSMRLRPDQHFSLFSFAVQSTSPMMIGNTARPAIGPAVRPPALAGKFYPATPSALASMVRSMLPNPLPEKRKWRAAMVPHAGLKFSGRIAAEVLAHLEFPETIIVIGPKHTPHGADWAVAPHETWSAPGIEIANDRELAQHLAQNIEHLQLDSLAHQAEHSIEVELPLLNHFAPSSKVVGIAVGSGSLESCQRFAAQLADALKSSSETLFLISSDMNHFASDEENRRLDEIAIKAIESLDTKKLFETVRGNNISMCGLLPAVITLEALHRTQPLTVAKRVNYATSAEVSGDTSRVVGYAGMLFN